PERNFSVSSDHQGFHSTVAPRRHASESRCRVPSENASAVRSIDTPEVKTTPKGSGEPSRTDASGASVALTAAAGASTGHEHSRNPDPSEAQRWAPSAPCAQPHEICCPGTQALASAPARG